MTLEEALVNAQSRREKIIADIRSSGFGFVADALVHCPTCELTCPGIAQCPVVKNSKVVPAFDISRYSQRNSHYANSTA